MLDGVTGWSGVMPVESLVDVLPWLDALATLASALRGTNAHRAANRLLLASRRSLRGGFAMKIWLNVAEGAEYAGVRRDTVYTACERGDLRHVRIVAGVRSV